MDKLDHRGHNPLKNQSKNKFCISFLSAANEPSCEMVCVTSLRVIEWSSLRAGPKKRGLYPRALHLRTLDVTVKLGIPRLYDLKKSTIQTLRNDRSWRPGMKIG